MTIFCSYVLQVAIAHHCTVGSFPVQANFITERVAYINAINYLLKIRLKGKAQYSIQWHVDYLIRFIFCSIWEDGTK